ncbi:hypothetical protein CGCVW01_v004420, partial [Colletotrichum viniferum]
CQIPDKQRPPASQPPCLPQRTPGPDESPSLTELTHTCSIFSGVVVVVVVVVACGLRLQRATWGPCAWLLATRPTFGITITFAGCHGSYMTIITVWWWCCCCCSTDNLACLRQKKSRLAEWQTG